MTDATLRLGIDARSAAKGASDYTKSTDKVKKGAKEAADSNKRVSSTLDGVAKSAQLVDGPLGGLASRLTTVSSAAKSTNIGLLAMGATLGAGLLAGRKFIRNTVEQERSVTQLNAALRSTQGAANITSIELQTMASQLQEITTFGDEATISAQAMLLTFTKIGRDVFPEALKSIQDVSVAMGQDLKTSTIQLGKALNDPITGLSALTRVGITFSESQKEVIKSMQEAGDIAGAQLQILKELETQFGGSAEAARNTLGGALASLSNTWGDLFEATTDNAQAIAGFINTINDLLKTLFLEEELSEITKIQREYNSTLLDAEEKYRRAITASGDYKKALELEGEELVKNAKLQKEAVIAAQEKDLQRAEKEFQKLSSKFKPITPSFGDNISPAERVFIKGREAINRGIRQSSIELVKQRKELEESRKELEKIGTTQERVTKEFTKGEKGISDYSDALKTAQSIIKSTATPQERIIVQLERIDELLQALPESEIEAREGLLRSQERLEEQYDNIGDAVKELTKTQLAELETQEKAFENMLSSIQGELSDFFRGFADGTIESMSDVIDRAKDLFFTFIADLAAKAATEQIIIPIVAGGGGQSSGGGFGGLLSGFGGISSALDVFGAETFGIGAFTGAPLLPGQTGISGLGLGGILGSTATGFGVGSFANSLLGGNELGGNIGAGVGALAGTLAFGPLGGLLGGAAGGALGGLFGSEGTEASEFSGLTGGDTGLYSRLYGSKNADVSIAQGIADAVGSLSLGLGSLSGVNVNDLLVEGGLNTKQKGGGFFTFQGQDILFDENNPDSLNSALARLSVAMLEAGDVTNESISTAIQNLSTEGRSLEEVLGDLQFAAAFEELSFVEETATQAEQAIAALNEQFDAAVAKARELGLEEQRINDARDDALETLRTDFNQSISDRILELTNPKQAELNRLDDTYDAIRENAIGFNGDLLLVERAYQLERQNIIKEGVVEVASTLGDTVSGLQSQLTSISQFNRSILLSEVGGLSSENRRGEALRQFQSVQAAYNEGDATLQEVQASGQALLNASKDYFSFTKEFYDDQALVLDFTRQIEQDTREQLTTAEMQLQQEQEQTSLLEQIRDNVANDNISDSSLLRAGEDASVLYRTNQLNDITEEIVRQAKVLAGGSFATSSSFADQVRAGTADGDLFNQLIVSLGGKAQNFATGGIAEGLAITGEQGRELSFFGESAKVLSTQDTNKILNRDNSDVVRAVNQVAGRIEAYQKQDSNQTNALLERLEMLLDEFEVLASNQRVASA